MLVLVFSMIYGRLYRVGERSQFWSFRFKSKKAYEATLRLLNEVKDTKISKYRFEWKWNRWTLETNRLSDFPKKLRKDIKESKICETPEELINHIERLHGFWDELIP